MRGSRDTSSQWQLHPKHLAEAKAVSINGLPMTSHSTQILASLGLHYHRSFHRNSVFLLALGPTLWMAMVGFAAFQPLTWHAIWSPVFLSVALWQPMVEKLLFRSIIQGHLMQAPVGAEDMGWPLHVQFRGVSAVRIGPSG